MKTLTIFLIFCALDDTTDNIEENFMNLILLKNGVFLKEVRFGIESVALVFSDISCGSIFSNKKPLAGQSAFGKSDYSKSKSYCQYSLIFDIYANLRK